MNLLVLSHQHKVKARWRPFCSCPLDEAVPGALRCKIQPVLDRRLLLGAINISEAPRPLCALLPRSWPSRNTSAADYEHLNEHLSPLMIYGLHSFRGNVYLSSALAPTLLQRKSNPVCDARCNASAGRVCPELVVPLLWSFYFLH